MPNTFSSHASALESPAHNAFDIIPSDVEDMPLTSRAIYIGTGGSLVVKMASGAVVTFRNLPDGGLLPVQASRVSLATDRAHLTDRKRLS